MNMQDGQHQVYSCLYGKGMQVVIIIVALLIQKNVTVQL